MKRSWSVSVMVMVLASPVAAQQSASYKLGEHVLNSGGHPRGGAVPSSASFRISLDAVGDAAAASALSSASHRSDAGFAAAYPAPLEVLNLRFTTKTALAWTPERSAGVYNLYRGSLASLSGLGYGTCFAQALSSAGASDGDSVPNGGGFAYLATAVNRLDEEGSKGFRSNGAERHGNTCP